METTDGSQFILFVLWVLVLGGVAFSLRIVKEYERLAVFTLGRFHSLKGPGLVFLSPGVQRAHRIALGAKGSPVTASVARFDAIELPVESDHALVSGQQIKVVGFASNALRVEPETASSNVCPKCGHEF